jgi:hydrogenase maturation factor
LWPADQFSRHEKLCRAAGRKTLAECGVAIITGDTMAHAAQKVVKAVKEN